MNELDTYALALQHAQRLQLSNSKISMAVSKLRVAKDNLDFRINLVEEITSVIIVEANKLRAPFIVNENIKNGEAYGKSVTRALINVGKAHVEFSESLKALVELINDELCDEVKIKI